jgi:hypothetical protein
LEVRKRAAVAAEAQEIQCRQGKWPKHKLELNCFVHRDNLLQIKFLRRTIEEARRNINRPKDLVG